ncbi:MAG: bifunctional acetate--CoA ligase family protein/GNAT family N-acetyltransferase [Candidatus Sulfotelmatobacter sp.]
MATITTNSTETLGLHESITIDPAHDVFRARPRLLDAVFSPKVVAVVGASERPGSVGQTVLSNLVATPFGGDVYPINPKRPTVLGIPAFARIVDLPKKPDLIVVTTPAATVPEIIQEAVDAGVPAAIIISAGFKEHGEAGKELERRIREISRGKMRIVGPNCLGVMNPVSGLNATFAKKMARPGRLAFISQSGALGTAVLDWSLREMVGFSSFASVGSMLDVGWGDLIDFFGRDPNTDSIAIYMESIGDARAFLSAAREVSMSKPIVIIKAGRTAAAAKAAASHTGSLTGSDEVLDAAFHSSGVLRVNSIGELFYVVEVLAKQPRPRGPRLTILTNAGGPGVLATDALIAAGGQLSELADETMRAFDSYLPPHWSHNNPVDILGDAEPERYAKALEIAAKDPNTDGMLVVLTPQGMTNPTQIAEHLVPYAHSTGKPISASWMGGDEVAQGEEILRRAGIPAFEFPDAAAVAFNYTWRYASNLKALYETPAPRRAAEHDRDLAKNILHKVRESGRTILTEYESKGLLAAYGIPTVRTELAKTSAEAARKAEAIGYPIVLKLNSETITHKTDVGGVKLNLHNAGEVKTAFEEIKSSVTEKKGAEHFLGVTVQPMSKLEGYELIIGSSIDSQLGPVLLFGTGGQLVEVWKDRALALPPLNTALARQLMEDTKIFTALKGVRGRPPVDLQKLDGLLVSFSELVVEQPWIKEIDINPLLASPAGLLALDARVVLHEPETAESDLPKPAIRPYPIQCVRPFTLEDGREVMIRPIRPEDEPLIVRFHDRLSENTVVQRYFKSLDLQTRTAHERLERICAIDYDRELSLVAEMMDPINGRQIIGATRMIKTEDGTAADLALVIADDYHYLGLGTELMKRSLAAARAERLKRLLINFLPENANMKALAGKIGFKTTPDASTGLIHGELELPRTTRLNVK